MVCSWLCAGLPGELREVTTATSVLCKMGACDPLPLCTGCEGYWGRAGLEMSEVEAGAMLGAVSTQLGVPGLWAAGCPASCPAWHRSTTSIPGSTLGLLFVFLLYSLRFYSTFPVTTTDAWKLCFPLRLLVIRVGFSRQTPTNDWLRKSCC